MLSTKLDNLSQRLNVVIDQLEGSLRPDLLKQLKDVSNDLYIESEVQQLSEVKGE